MKLEIEIPVEFVKDFNKDNFNDFFYRVIADMSNFNGMCGLYEMEIAYMLLKVFEDAKMK